MKMGGPVVKVSGLDKVNGPMKLKIFKMEVLLKVKS